MFRAPTEPLQFQRQRARRTFFSRDEKYIGKAFSFFSDEPSVPCLGVNYHDHSSHITREWRAHMTCLLEGKFHSLTEICFDHSKFAPVFLFGRPRFLVMSLSNHRTEFRLDDRQASLKRDRSSEEGPFFFQTLAPMLTAQRPNVPAQSPQNRSTEAHGTVLQASLYNVDTSCLPVRQAGSSVLLSATRSTG